ncbi:hypothetical protein SSX86_025867 [Deinandra increscens subsp. villosa]|uniref:Uncharacterized protein n=1 Tax=Deinandra increscens subsp. villosa TaxID=3103831 RepID=A0AAP0CK29_9ASTR
MARKVSWQKKTSFTIINMFKTKKTNQDDDYLQAYKVFSSDQDGVRNWVAEPGSKEEAIKHMARKVSWQKKSSFTIINMFKTKKTNQDDDYLQAYKVFSSDQDGVRNWVAEPGIDKAAGAYIDNITNRWNHVDIAE